MNEVGKEVRRLRGELGLTGAQLAGRAGLTPSAVSQIETGKRTPNSASVVKLAEALGVGVADLYPKKVQAPLPLPDFAGRRRGAEELEEAPFYNQFEALGYVLAKSWENDLEEWDKKIPPGKVPNSFDFGRLLQWSLEIADVRKVYEALARDPGPPFRAELEDTLRMLEEVEEGAVEKVRSIVEPAKTFAEFKKIWEANDLDALMSKVESR